MEHDESSTTTGIRLSIFGRRGMSAIVAGVASSDRSATVTLSPSRLALMRAPGTTRQKTTLLAPPVHRKYFVRPVLEDALPQASPGLYEFRTIP